MTKNPALIFILIVALLFSMTEIYKVTMLGFTVLADAEKAAHFCTCVGCSHDQGMPNHHDDGNMASHGMNHHNQEESNQPAHCSTNSSDSGNSAYCACQSSPEKETPILINSLDKVALLTPVKTKRPSEKKREFYIYQNSHEQTLSKDVFHPPKRA